MDLNTIWFYLLGILLAGYAVLDGFDLGVGILHYAARSDRERRLFLNSIGPIWDGNEVWLVTFGGALFAGFPEAYATIFSGFYEVFMLVLTALIFRATAIEFRSKRESKRWRQFWDFCFFASSLSASLLFGLAVGNGLLGIPLNERGAFVGSVLDFSTPFPLLMAAMTAALFALHGALFLNLKLPEEKLHKRVQRWIWHTWGVFLALFLLTTIYALTKVPRAIPRAHGAAEVIVAVLVFSIAYIPRATFLRTTGRAFLASGLIILCLVALLGMCLFPNLVTASNNPDFSLTIYTAASSAKTLGILLTVACIGIPLILSYTTIVYWTFRKRVVLEEISY